jgi:hypothetical protein
MSLLPLYEFFIDPKKKNAGVKAISLVNEPAIESDFVLFSKDNLERYVFANQEKNMILGLALVPNKKIYRVDKTGKEYEGFFSAQTIELIRNKFMQEKNTDQVNLQHSDSEYVNGVYLVETYIVNTAEQQQVLLKKGIDAPIGSWAVQYHVDSPELFAEIKTGGYRGFSVEAFLDNQLSIQNPTMMEKENFTDGRIAETGQQVTYGKVGEPVKAIVDIKAGGNASESSLSDGQYTLEDGTIIAVKGGVLFEVEPKKESDTDYKVPTPDQIKEQQDAAVAKENKTKNLKMSKKENLAVVPNDKANAYQPTSGKAPEFKPEKPQELENDTTPAGAANNGSGLKVDPVKSIGQVPDSTKKRKIKTTKMKLKELSDKLAPATPEKTSEGKPSVPDTSKEQKVTTAPATPVKFSKEEWQKMSRYERLKAMLFAKDADSTPSVEKKTGDKTISNLAEVDPNEPQPTDAMPKGKAPEAPVAPEAPKEPVVDSTTKEVKAALPPDIEDDDDETPEESQQENEQELPLTDMDKTVNDLIAGKGDGQYNIMVMVEGGVITEAGMEMELSQDLMFAKVDKSKVDGKGNKKHNIYKMKFKKLKAEHMELLEKVTAIEAKLQKPINTPVFGNAPTGNKQNFTKDELSKMTPYERLAIQKGFRVINAK